VNAYLAWMTAVALCRVAVPAAGQAPPGAQLEEAQAAYDEARRLYGLGTTGSYEPGVTEPG
jgi:hypothetical protein